MMYFAICWHSSSVRRRSVKFSIWPFSDMDMPSWLWKAWTRRSLISSMSKPSLLPDVSASLKDFTASMPCTAYLAHSRSKFASSIM